MAAHSSVLAWRIPGTEEPGGLPSLGSHRVGHDCSDLAAAAAAASLVDLWTKKVVHVENNLTWGYDRRESKDKNSGTSSCSPAPPTHV